MPSRKRKKTHQLVVTHVLFFNRAWHIWWCDYDHSVLWKIKLFKNFSHFSQQLLQVSRARWGLGWMSCKILFLRGQTAGKLSFLNQQVITYPVTIILHDTDVLEILKMHIMYHLLKRRPKVEITSSSNELAFCPGFILSVPQWELNTA